MSRAAVDERDSGSHQVVAGDAADVAALIAASGLHPAALILGVRPARHSSRDRLLATLLRLETGKRLPRADGPRVYPIELVKVIGLDRRPDMDVTEAVVRAARAGCVIVQVPLNATADAKSKINFPLHLKLLARALSGWPHGKYGPRPPRRHRHQVLKDLWRWCNPIHAWRELRQGGASRNDMALGIAVGVFIANTPTYGVQLLLALHAARRLHLHPAAVVAGSKLSTPPVGPMLIALAACTGHFILHGSAPKLSDFAVSHGRIWRNAGPILLDWIIGAMIIGTVTAFLAFIVSRYLFRFVERGQKPGDQNSGSVVQS